MTTEGDVWSYPFLVLFSEKVVEDAGRGSRRVQVVSGQTLKRTLMANLMAQPSYIEGLKGVGRE